MARNKKPLEARISEIESKKDQLQAKIDNNKAKIAELDLKIEKLRNSKKQKELENLLAAIKATGKTPEEVLASLKKED